MKCKICRVNFHYCSSCDWDPLFDEGFCSNKCFEKSEEFKKFQNSLNRLWNSFNDQQKTDFQILWTNNFLSEPLYDKYINKIIKN